MTERELDIIKALQFVTFTPGSAPKRFARDMDGRAHRDPAAALSPKQSQYLECLAWRFRRQIPEKLIPTTKPQDVSP